MATLPASASVVVIGGGVMGASVAFHLAEAGVPDVLLIEQDDFAGGSTTKSAGGVRAQFSDPANIAIASRSLAAFERFGTRPGAEIDLRQVGYLFLHTDPVAWAQAQEAVDLQRSMGVASRLLTADEAAELSPPADARGVLGATFHARDGYCTPEAVVRGYVKGARELGATAVNGVRVTAIETSGGEVTGVVTDAGRVTAPTVICCVGAWTAPLAATCGIDLPVVPLRRQVIVTEPLTEAQRALFHDRVPMTIDAASTFYFHREGPGVLFGMSYAGEEPGFREHYSDAWDEDLAAAMERRAPALLDLGHAYLWFGHYETTPDHNALVGEAAGLSRFLYATGFSGHGFLMGPAIGEVMRDLYLGVDPVVDVSSLSAERFTRGDTVFELGIV